MKQFKNTIFLCCGLLGLSACSEDALTPDHEKRYDTFMPDASATDSTSILRREFKAETGCYLLFNDTLQHELRGYDFNGLPVYFTERLEINYEIGSSDLTSSAYSYVLLTRLEEQKQALQFLKERIMCHLGPGARPFSWFLTRKITNFNSNFNTTTYPSVATGERSIAVAFDYLLSASRTEAQLQRYSLQILDRVLYNLVMHRQAQFTDFRAVSNSDYGRTFTSTSNDDNTRILAEHGFLTKGENSSGIPTNGYYPNYQLDLTTYVTYAVTYDDATMERYYGNYPLVMQKFRLFKEQLTKIGFIF